MNETVNIQEKKRVDVEVLIAPNINVSENILESLVSSFLESLCKNYSNGPIDFSSDSSLVQYVQSIRICDIEDSKESIPFWLADLKIHVYQYYDEHIEERIEGSDVPAYSQWSLPCAEFESLWDHLVYEDSIKSDLLNYASTTFLFSQHHVNPLIIPLNRLLLLHGPPGTGKTSLCKALAQKFAIRYFSTFSDIVLIEINSHSLFSKWFSESGKLVMKLFDYIHDILNTSTMVFILIDEVESLSVTRKSALSGAEPSDGMRVVNALLTQIDKLRNEPRVLVMTTSNLSDRIDEAFVDRADIKRYIGNPGYCARWEILRDCLNELIRAGLVMDTPEWSRSVRWCEWKELKDDSPLLQLLRYIVIESDELSGRMLRKLPFTAYSCVNMDGKKMLSLRSFLDALADSIRKEKRDRRDFVQKNQTP